MEILLARAEAKQPGVYLLTGVNPITGEPLAYIGEAEEIAARLRHHRTKEFWIHAIAFVSKDENLTKSHIRFLEGRLIEEAKKVGRFKLENDQPSGAKLPEADREEMDVFLNFMRQLLPILGCDLLVPAVIQPASVKGGKLVCKIKDLVAHGNRSPGGFVVFKGSQAVATDRNYTIKNQTWTFKKRQELLTAGILKKEDTCLRFMQDYEFTSPSGAASVIRGGNSNGQTNWRAANGKTLKQLEAHTL